MGHVWMLNLPERQEMVTSRRDRHAFAGAAIALAVLFMGNNLPSALYGVLRAAFGYSSLTQTLLYAAAVAVILPGLAIFGPLSDGVGAHRLHAVSAQLVGLGPRRGRRHRRPLRAAHPVGGRGRERVSRGSSRRLKLIQTMLGVPRPFHIHQ